MNSDSWKCAVCGYVHRGAQPPATCPVCGAPANAFETYSEPAPSPPQPTVGWTCLVCGYSHKDREAPNECPVCGAGADCFESQKEAEPQNAEGQEAGNVIVVGAGIAGLSAVESLRSASPDSRIVLISRESHPPYYRLNLTRYLAGEITDTELPIHSESWYERNEIRFMGGVEVTSINPESKNVQISNGETLPFDKLILTAGAHPFVPPLPGTRREGITCFRTVEDARRILEAAQKGRKCICLGGGILGLETAGALARQGADVSIVEGFPWLLPRQLNQKAGGILRQHVENMGIKLHCGVHATEVLGDERVRGIQLEDGSTVEGDLVVVASGIRSNSYLARLAGLEVNRGVVVNNHMVTSHPDILAAGDVCEHQGAVYGIWPASQYQGRIAGLNAAGQLTEFAGIPRSNTVKVLNIDVFSVGRVEPEDGSYSVIDSHAGDTYQRYLFHDNRLVGAVLMGDTSLTAVARESIENRADFSNLLRKSPQAPDIAAALAEKSS